MDKGACRRLLADVVAHGLRTSIAGTVTVAVLDEEHAAELVALLAARHPTAPWDRLRVLTVGDA
jgi:hypothetical protein